MIKKIFTYLAIAIIGFTLSINLTGCKKETSKDAPAVEESSEDDISTDEENAETE